MIRCVIALCVSGFALAASAQDADRATVSGPAFERLRAECVAFKTLSNLRRFDGKAGPHECMEGEVRLFAHLSGGVFDPARILATQPTAAGASSKARTGQLERECASAKALYAHLGFDLGDTEDPAYDARACSDIELQLYRPASAPDPALLLAREPTAAGPQAQLKRRVMPPSLFKQDRDSNYGQASD